MKHIIYLGLGSNVGDTKEHITQATIALKKLAEPLTVAEYYLSKPVGYSNQASFLNTVVKGTTNLSPSALLFAIKTLEKNLGRKYRFRWGPREIDIDILLYDQLVLDTEALSIPHPRMHEREFVLKPLEDLAPDYVHPVFQRSVRELLSALPEENRSLILSSQ